MYTWLFADHKPKINRPSILPLRVKYPKVGVENRRWHLALTLPILNTSAAPGRRVRAGCCTSRKQKARDSPGKNNEKQWSEFPCPGESDGLRAAGLLLRPSPSSAEPQNNIKAQHAGFCNWDLTFVLRKRKGGLQRR